MMSSSSLNENTVEYHTFNTNHNFFRQITGAMVILSDTDEISADGRERTITIKGPKESVTLARYLINAR